MNMDKTTMEDVGLTWNPKKCAVVHVRRGVDVTDNSGMILDETARIPSLEDGKQYKFLEVPESATKEDKLVLECAAKEYLRRISVIWTSPLSDRNRVTASNQFSLPVLGLISHVDATVADNGYTGDRQESSEHCYSQAAQAQYQRTVEL